MIREDRGLGHTPDRAVAASSVRKIAHQVRHQEVGRPIVYQHVVVLMGPPLVRIRDVLIPANIEL